jgi:hypothetical protein
MSQKRKEKSNPYKKLHDTLSRIGSQKLIAEKLGIGQTAVSGWRRLGWIPNHHMPKLLELAETEELQADLAPWSRAARLTANLKNYTKL